MTTTISTLNIRHGGGSRTDKIILALQNLNSDILVLTEYRNNENGTRIKSALTELGFANHYTTNANPKENSVLITCKQEFKSELFQILKEHSQRVIKISSVDFTLFGTYFPNGDEKKYVFDFLLKYIEENPDERIIITGDINTGKHYIDEAGATFFHSNYIDKLEEHGFIDAWRMINKDKKEFTWYSSFGNGFRLDHFFVHPSLKGKLKNCFYTHQTRIEKITDHSLMTLELL